MVQILLPGAFPQRLYAPLWQFLFLRLLLFFRGIFFFLISLWGRGIRTENLPEASSVRVTSEAMQIEPMLVAPIAAAPMLIVLMVLFLTGGKRKR